MSTIRFENITKVFAEANAPAVDNCSFKVAGGSFVVLLGPSGCGKTTLLKMVNRLYEPTSGTITLDGVDIRELEPTVLRRQVGYVIQQVGLFPHMTVAQNVAVVPELLGWSKDKIQARVRELLTLVALPPDEYCARYPSQLSGGQQQRVGVARALAGDPKVVLMDEPFGAIDAITRSTLQDEMLRLQRKLKKTVIFVTHDVEEALYLADKIVIMREGQVVQYNTPLEILTHPVDKVVRELVGADDMIRQLSLVRVASAMTGLPPNYRHNVEHAKSTDAKTKLGSQPGGEPTVDCDDTLRHALSLLLQTGAPTLTVVEHAKTESGVEESTPVGLLSLEQIRASTPGGDQAKPEGAKGKPGPKVPRSIVNLKS